MTSLRTANAYDGCSSEELALTLAVPHVILFTEVGSTLDVAHRLAERGAPPGTLIIADAQTAGRGRMGRSWRSEPGAGIWLTLLERPQSDDALGVLALRLALALAPALDRFAPEPVRLKWPNDIFLGDRKLAGVLVEARWHGPRLDWLAVGVGINVRAPRSFEGAALPLGTRRTDILRAVIPSLRTAAARVGELTEEELARFHERDLAFGMACVEPAPGVVAGLRRDGALLVDDASGRAAFHTGSLILTSTLSLGMAT
jgi:BirA family biotin operon repressor/biotin-[acetyl-CoA-carboxylase] ligase